MKKLKKLLPKRKKEADADSVPHRITNETVAEHRERILAGGRRFKYPVQYARHKLVINAIIIAIVALIATVLIIWWQLYHVQNTSTFFYRIARVIPVPVASVDGQLVPYSDYLVGFRSQEHYLQHKEGVELYSAEFADQLNYIKRQALDDAIADAYAEKLAKELNVRITEQQIDQAIERQRQSRNGVTSKEAYDAIVLDHFNWSPAEAREVTAARLLRQEVAYKIDSEATRKRDKVEELLKSEKDFAKVVEAASKQGAGGLQSGTTPMVPSNNQDGGLAEQASRLAIDGISKPFRSTTGDGYYFVKLLDKDGNNRVSYAFIKVPLLAFFQRLESIKKENKVAEYISIPAAQAQRRN